MGIFFSWLWPSCNPEVLTAPSPKIPFIPVPKGEPSKPLSALLISLTSPLHSGAGFYAVCSAKWVLARQPLEPAFIMVSLSLIFTALGILKIDPFYWFPQPQAGQIYYLRPSIEMGNPSFRATGTACPWSGTRWGNWTQVTESGLPRARLCYMQIGGGYSELKGTLAITDHTRALQLEQTEPTRWQDSSLWTEPGPQFFTPGLGVLSPGLECLCLLPCLGSTEF